MKSYETTVIIDTLIDRERSEEVIKKIEAMIAEEGEIIRVEKWGKKRLAYPIDKKPTGYYVHFVYKANPQLPQIMERDFNLNADILRSLTVTRTDKMDKQIVLDQQGTKKAE